MANPYVCAFCNKAHDNIADYAKCVRTCSYEAEQKEKEAEAKRLHEEKAARIGKINAAYDYFKQLDDEFYKIYGYHYRPMTWFSPFEIVRNLC